MCGVPGCAAISSAMGFDSKAFSASSGNSIPLFCVRTCFGVVFFPSQSRMQIIFLGINTNSSDERGGIQNRISLWLRKVL